MTIAPLALDVTVVGAGQAGLVTGYFLKRAGLDVRRQVARAGAVLCRRSWQSSRASALLCGVGDDAAGIVIRITEWLRRSAAPASPVALGEGGDMS